MTWLDSSTASAHAAGPVDSPCVGDGVSRGLGVGVVAGPGQIAVELGR